MPIVQFGGPIGPFLDRVQQRGVPVNVFANCEYMMNGPVSDPAGLDNEVKSQLFRAIKEVIGQKMESGQLQFRNLGEGNVGAALGQIVAASRLAQIGVHIGNLGLQFGIDGHNPQPPPQQQQPQHVVEARINIGGLRINASSDKGVDTAGLQNQLKDKAKSQIVWWGIGCGILLLVGIGIVGMGLYIWHEAIKPSGASAAANAAASKWDGTTPFTCGGNDDLKIEKVTATFTSGTAITAGGNCKLKLVNVKLTAPTVIEAGGNSTVIVEGGSLDGSTLAVSALGNAQVNMSGTTVKGKTKGTKITGP